MSVELAHQKAGKHLCVALHRKLRIRYPLLWYRTSTCPFLVSSNFSYDTFKEEFNQQI